MNNIFKTICRSNRYLGYDLDKEDNENIISQTSNQALL